MLIPGTLLSFVLLPAFWVVNPQASIPGSQGLPANFKITAEYEGGAVFAKLWRTTITVDGKATQEITGPKGSQTIDARFSRTDLQRLFRIIQDTQFFELNGQYRHPSWDSSVYTLTISANNKTHKVSVDSWNIIMDSKEVKRFMKVLNEVEKKLPSPNSKPKAEWKDWIACYSRASNE